MSYFTKEWDWINNKDNYWLIPSEEIFYLSERWKNKGFNSFLDLGCGLGRHSVFMAKKGFDVVAVDLSEVAVGKTKAWSDREDCNVKTIVSDFTNLPFSDNSFDCILAYNVIYHTDTKGFTDSLNEIKRILKPNGEIFLTLISKNTYSYKHSNNYSRIDDNTLLRNNSDTEINVPHFYVDYEDIIKYFKNWIFVNLPREWTDYSPKSENRFSTHWSLLLKKGE
ncbi:MAG: class I SAM-dependent methyltransferase [Eubacterium sp.]